MQGVELHDSVNEALRSVNLLAAGLADRQVATMRRALDVEL